MNVTRWTINSPVSDVIGHVVFANAAVDHRSEVYIVADNIDERMRRVNGRTVGAVV